MPKASPLVADLAHHLRQRILAGEFRADDPVTESGLAAHYGVARPTAKSAVDLLVSEGLLVRSPFAALRVARVSADDLHEIVALLTVSENAALERIARLDPDLRELRRTVTAGLAMFLDVMVRCAGSARLEAVHRRATFELVLFSVQHPHVTRMAVPEPGTAPLAEALVTGRYSVAKDLLSELQRARVARLPAPHAQLTAN